MTQDRRNTQLRNRLKFLCKQGLFENQLFLDDAAEEIWSYLIFYCSCYRAIGEFDLPFEADHGYFSSRIVCFWHYWLLSLAGIFCLIYLYGFFNEYMS